MYSAISFFVVLILIGVPLWWKTTEVYRFSLPYSQIDVLHEHKLTIQMNIHVMTIDNSRGTAIVEDLKKFFQISSESMIYLNFNFD